MASYTYSALANVDTLMSSGNFSTSDTFYFDDSSISAASLLLSITGVDLVITATNNPPGATPTPVTKTITLKGFTQNKISTSNFIFADSSQLIIGDGTSDTSNDDLLSGNALISTNYNDYLDGMLGTDTVSYANAPAAVTVDLVNGTASGGAGSDKLKAIENIIGSNYNDSLTGIASGSQLDGGTGIDTLTGGAGNDTYVVTAGDVIIDAGTTDNDTVISRVDYALAVGLENLTLLSDAVVGIGNAVANTMIGNDMPNVLDGQVGADTLMGGMGDDVYFVDDVGDKVMENSSAGTDTIITSANFTLTGTGVNDVENLQLTGTASIYGIGNSLDNIIYANSGVNTLDGGDGIDTLSYQFGATSGVTIDMGIFNPQPTVGSGTDTITGFENLIGSHYDDVLTGNSGDNWLKGSEGNDTLAGASGNDTLEGGVGSDNLAGGPGNDSYYIDDTADSIAENAGAGSDTVLSRLQSYTMTSLNLENLTLVADSGAMNGIGNTANNLIQGNALDNSLSGVAGNDSIWGGSGKDTLTGDAGNDVINGDDGEDSINAGVDNDTITGGLGRDTVMTGTGIDVIKFGKTNTDSFCTTASISGVDLYSDLTLNAGTGDLIDLRNHVNAVVSSPLMGRLNESTFVTNMNTLLGASGAGFKTHASGVDAAILTASSGDLSGRTFLAVDLNHNDVFSATDFVIEITGSSITSLTTATFI